MNILDEIRGQDRAKELLERMASSGEVPPSILFLGPSGVGKRMTAEAFFRILTCSGGSGRDNCLSCRLIDAGNHPDYIALDEISGETSPGVETVRETRRILGLSSAAGGYRMVFIPSGERLSPAAAGCLLKMIEEPPPKTFFVISAPHALSLIATIRSRSFRIPFTPLGEEETRAILAENHPGEEDLDFWVRAAGGAPGLVMDIIDSKSSRSLIEALLTAVREGETPEIGKIDREELLRIAGIASNILRHDLDLAGAEAMETFREAILGNAQIQPALHLLSGPLVRAAV